LTTSQVKDRENVSQLLTVAKLQSLTGAVQAATVLITIKGNAIHLKQYLPLLVTYSY